jgi:hypothetical protein
MKKFVVFLLPFAVGCHSKTLDEKLQDGIKAHLAKTMHDFKSYEPVEFKKPDSAYTNFAESERGKALFDSTDRYNKTQENYLERARRYTYTAPRVALGLINEGKEYGVKADSLLKLIDKEKDLFTKRFSGYKMLHTFRGKNMNGATIIITKRFYFDTAFNVTKSVEVE